MKIDSESKLKLWTLEDRRVRADLIVVFVKEPSSIKLETFLELDNKGITRGHQWKLKKKRCNTDLRQNFFSESVINMWNNLDKHVVSATSINCFKNRPQKMRDKDGSTFCHRLTNRL